VGESEEFTDRLNTWQHQEVGPVGRNWRDEVLRARPLADTMAGRYEGWTAMTSVPLGDLRSAIGSVNAMWDEFWGAFTEHGQVSEDLWLRLPAEHLPGWPSYYPEAERLRNAIGLFYATVDTLPRYFPPTSTTGDLVGAGGEAAAGAGDLLGKILEQLRKFTTPILIGAGVIVGVVVLVKVAPMLKASGGAT
jgi:hypothetical protein